MSFRSYRALLLRQVWYCKKPFIFIMLLAGCSGFKSRLLWQPLHVHNSVSSECSLIIFCLLLYIHMKILLDDGHADGGGGLAVILPTYINMAELCTMPGDKTLPDRGQCDMYRTHSGWVLSNLKRSPAKCLSSTPPRRWRRRRTWPSFLAYVHLNEREYYNSDVERNLCRNAFGAWCGGILAKIVSSTTLIIFQWV